MKRKKETDQEYRTRMKGYADKMRKRAAEKAKSKPPKPRKPIAKKTKLRKKGKSTSAKSKERIQALLRQIVIKRDGTCVIGKYPHKLGTKWINCGPQKEDGGLVVQAEHLVGRANSLTYSDLRNILLVCKRHHFYLKHQNANLYWEIVREHLGEEHWALIEGWRKDKFPHPMRTADWLAKEEELKALTN